MAEKRIKEASQEPESLYSADELAACAKQVFNAHPDIVRAALRVEGMTKATVSDAKKIVEKFRKKEV